MIVGGGFGCLVCAMLSVERITEGLGCCADWGGRSHQLVVRAESWFLLFYHGQVSPQLSAHQHSDCLFCFGACRVLRQWRHTGSGRVCAL